MTTSIRRVDDSRKREREARAARKAEEKQQKMEELKRLKSLKKQEIMEKIEKIKEIAGDVEGEQSLVTWVLYCVSSTATRLTEVVVLRLQASTTPPSISKANTIQRSTRLL